MAIFLDYWCEGAPPAEWTGHDGLGSITVGAGFSAGARGTNGYRLLADVAGRNSSVFETQNFGTIPQGERYYLGFKLQIKVAPTAVLQAALFKVGASKCQLMINVARTVYCWHTTDAGDAASTAGAALNVDQWYWVVFSLLRSTADGEDDGDVNVWIDGVHYSWSDGDADNWSSWDGDVDQIAVGIVSNAGGVPDVWIDDVRFGDQYPAPPVAGDGGSMMMMGA